MNILFMCVGNSARSQIAEGLANAMLGLLLYLINTALSHTSALAIPTISTELLIAFPT